MFNHNIPGAFAVYTINDFNDERNFLKEHGKVMKDKMWADFNRKKVLLHKRWKGYCLLSLYDKIVVDWNILL